MQDDHVYCKTDLVGSSKESVTKATETAIARAAKTLRHIEWFEVGEIRGCVQDGKKRCTAPNGSRPSLTAHSSRLDKYGR